MNQVQLTANSNNSRQISLLRDINIVCCTNIEIIFSKPSLNRVIVRPPVACSFLSLSISQLPAIKKYFKSHWMLKRLQRRKEIIEWLIGIKKKTGLGQCISAVRGVRNCHGVFKTKLSAVQPGNCAVYQN